ncbi:uncharacterized protein LOC111900354 [Lactuca sativa]|uniref:uncharacterized protein LOC111900354 n=1 Tax=Lactuca sativa TaxID=4236 RepID=UPI000CD9C906|nr:uncharacterized protein LOC111900354 [Lactuca sativa]
MIKDGDKFDIKSLGPHTVGLIMQNRKVKVVFQGLHPQVKFGDFAEINESSESHGMSEKTLFEPTSSERVISEDVITVSDQDDDEAQATVAHVAEEHELQPVHVQSDYNEGSGNDKEVFEDVDLTGFDNDDIPLNFGSNDEFMTGEDLDNLLEDDDEVAHTTTETREKEDVLLAAPPVSNPSAEIANPMVTVSGIPPLDDVLPTSTPMESDHHTTQDSPPPTKIHIIVLRLATQSASTSPTTTLAIVSAEPITERPSTFFETESPSLSELQKQVDAVSQKNVELDQRNIELYIKVADLQAENTQLSIQMAELTEQNAAKTKQITDLHTHFVLLTGNYYDLKKNLEDKFGDEFKSSV